MFFLPWWNLCITLSQNCELCLTISLAHFLYFWQFDQIFHRQKYFLPLGIWQLCFCKVAQVQYANRVRNLTRQRDRPKRNLNKDRLRCLYSELYITANELGLLVLTSKSQLLVWWLCIIIILFLLFLVFQQKLLNQNSCVLAIPWDL